MSDDSEIDSPDPSAHTLTTALSEIPEYFVVDPPDELTGPRSGSFESKAKSPHGMGRTGVVLIDDRTPSAGRPVIGRRPVIAVVDTAIGAHPWLETDAEPDPFWRTPKPEEGWPGPELGDGQPDPGARAYGHATFIAGLVRQLAPEARILSLPVMTEDGHARTEDVLNTLNWLLGRVREAREPGRSDLFVDVINLSFGWYRGLEDKAFPADEHYRVLHDLAEEGVQVVASAGNRSTTVPVYPAAFALDQAKASSPPATPLVSVGALDPDGDVAAYSNSGDWVKLLAPGTGLISTVPPISGVDWSHPPVDERGCRYPNPNHMAHGFARWGGTSFAAAWVSARIAGHLVDDRHSPALMDVEASSAHVRAARALAATVDGPDVRQADGWST